MLDTFIHTTSTAKSGTNNSIGVHASEMNIVSKVAASTVDKVSERVRHANERAKNMKSSTLH